MSSSDLPSVRGHLRTVTAAAHARLDTLSGALRFDRRVDYGRFLVAHAAALFPLEDALEAQGIERLLPDWPLRARTGALAEDLADLGLTIDILPPPHLDSDAALLGAAYVLEGSRLGARVVLSRVDTKLPTRYLRHGKGARLWPTFQQALEAAPCVHADLDGAASGALKAFQLFEYAFDVLMEPAH